VRTKTALKTKTPLKAKTRLRTSPKPKKQSKPPISKLKKEADRLFSLATRYRFAEEIDGKYYARCVTCVDAKLRPLKELQCGHFQSRRFNATRYSEINTAPQDYACNVMQYGQQYRFANFIDDFYGDGTAKRLEKEAREPHPFTREELEQVIHDSKEYIRAYQNN